MSKQRNQLFQHRPNLDEHRRIQNLTAQQQKELEYQQQFNQANLSHQTHNQREFPIYRPSNLNSSSAPSQHHSLASNTHNNLHNNQYFHRDQYNSGYFNASSAEEELEGTQIANENAKEFLANYNQPAAGKSNLPADAQYRDVIRGIGYTNDADSLYKPQVKPISHRAIEQDSYSRTGLGSRPQSRPVSSRINTNQPIPERAVKQFSPEIEDEEENHSIQSSHRSNYQQSVPRSSKADELEAEYESQPIYAHPSRSHYHRNEGHYEHQEHADEDELPSESQQYSDDSQYDEQHLEDVGALQDFEEEEEIQSYPSHSTQPQQQQNYPAQFHSQAAQPTPSQSNYSQSSRSHQEPQPYYQQQQPRYLDSQRSSHVVATAATPSYSRAQSYKPVDTNPIAHIVPDQRSHRITQHSRPHSAAPEPQPASVRRIDPASVPFAAGKRAALQENQPERHNSSILNHNPSQNPANIARVEPSGYIPRAGKPSGPSALNPHAHHDIFQPESVNYRPQKRAVPSYNSFASAAAPATGLAARPVDYDYSRAGSRSEVQLDPVTLERVRYSGPVEGREAAFKPQKGGLTNNSEVFKAFMQQRNPILQDTEDYKPQELKTSRKPVYYQGNAGNGSRSSRPSTAARNNNIETAQSGDEGHDEGEELDNSELQGENLIDSESEEEDRKYHQQRSHAHHRLPHPAQSSAAAPVVIPAVRIHSNMTSSELWSAQNPSSSQPDADARHQKRFITDSSHRSNQIFSPPSPPRTLNDLLRDNSAQKTQRAAQRDPNGSNSALNQYNSGPKAGDYSARGVAKSREDERVAYEAELEQIRKQTKNLALQRFAAREKYNYPATKLW
jgi:hypothetical protein